MTSYAKPLPAPRGIPTRQSVDGSLVPTQQMESEETDCRPRPPIRPKPKVLPKPLTKVPSTDAGLTLPSSMPWSPKSPVSEVPSAEKINLLTGPKPYGATSSGIGIRRPSLTFKRQTSESLPVDEVCTRTAAPESKTTAPLAPSASPRSRALPHDTPGLTTQTEVDSVRREPIRQEPTIANANAKDARPPVMKKPAVSFHVKHVLGAPKPGRFPGTTVEQILAKMEEEKSTGLALGSDRPWAQRSSLSFDSGHRFSSNAYSSFHRSPSTTEGPQEGEEERGGKEVGSSCLAVAPASPPLLPGPMAWSATKQSHGSVEAAPQQESALPSDKSPERRTDFVSTVTGHLEDADSSTVTSMATDSPSAKIASLWNKAPENMPETQSWTVVQEPSSVHLEEEPPASIFLSRKPLVPSESPPAIEKDTRAGVEQELPSTLSSVGEIHGPADAPVSSRTSLEKELVSSLLLGGAPLVPSSLESPAVDRVSPKETEATEVATPLKDSYSFARDPYLMESSHRKVIADTPIMSERSMGEMDWNLSESFEWSSPAKRSEWSKISTNTPSPSRHEESVDHRLSGNAGSVSDPCTYSNVLVGTAPGIYSPHDISMGGSQEHPETVAAMDQTRSDATTTTDRNFSSQEAMVQEHPSNIQDYETLYEKGELPWQEHRQYSGNQTESFMLDSSQREEAVSMTTPEMLKKKDDLIIGRASSRMVDEGLPSGTYVVHGSYDAHRSSEEPLEEAGGERSRTVTFQAEEVFEPHTATTKVLQVESDLDVASSAGLAGAREVIEPLRPILLSDPAAEPCILVHGLGPLEHAMPSREDDSCLAKLKDKGERTECGSSYGHETEPQRMAHAPDEGGMNRFMTNAGQTFEVSDFDPIRSDLVTKKELDVGSSSSQWLEELLSPTSAAEDVERKHQESLKSAESKNGLLGWSQKDLQNEFGTGVSEQNGQSKSVWDDRYGIGVTNRSQELDFGNSDWSKRHAIEESSWRKELEPPNTDWSAKHNIGDLRQSGESDISHTDWSAKHNIGDLRQSGESDISHTDWSAKHNIEDPRQSRESDSHTDWSAKHNIGDLRQSGESDIRHTDWSAKHNIGDLRQSGESDSHTDLSAKHNIGDLRQSGESDISHTDWSAKHNIGDLRQSGESDISHTDWSAKHNIEDPRQSGESDSHMDWSVTHSMEDTTQVEEPDIGHRKWSSKQSEEDQSAEAGVTGRDYSAKHSIESEPTAHGKEPEVEPRDWSMSHSMEERTLSKEPEIGHHDSKGEKHESDESGFSYKDWSMKHSVEGGDQSLEPGIIGREWSLKHSMRDGAQSDEPDILGKDWSIKHNVGDTYQFKEPEIGIGDLSITQSMGEQVPGGESRVMGRDWSISHTLLDSGKDKELEIRRHDSSSNKGEIDGSRKQNIGEIGRSEDLAAQSTDWTSDQHTEHDAQSRLLGDGSSITGTSQLGEGGHRDSESRMDVGEMETGRDLDQMDRLREIGRGGDERRDEHEAERYVPVHAVERELGDGEVERTCKPNVEAVEGMPDVRDGQRHRNYIQYGESAEPGDALNTGSSTDLSISSPHEALQTERPSSSLLDDILGRGTSRQSPPNERPTSLQSGHSQESEEKPMDYTSPSQTEVDSPRKSVEAVRPIESHADVEREQSQSDESKDRAQSMQEEEGEAAEEMEETQVPEADFSFLEETEVLDCSVHRTRASLSRKRGHRVPTARPGAAVNSTECDGDDWMFQDSTEPKVPRPDSLDEETLAAAAAAAAAAATAEEEQPQKSSKKSPVSQGKKLGIFAGFNPLALKAKLKSRKSAEEGEQPKSPRQKDNFQRSKSCKLPAESGKPLVLPPKPEKASGSESSTPQWLSALKIKKKPPK